MRKKLAAIFAYLVGLVWPLSKTKLHRLIHFALTASTVAASVIVWLQGQRWGWSTANQFEAQLFIVGAFIARAREAFKRADAIVDKLPIPVASPEDKGVQP